MENGVGVFDLHDRAVGKHFLHALLEAVPFRGAPEIVEHQKSAIEQVIAQSVSLLLAEIEAAGLDHVDEGIIGQLLIGQAEEQPIGIDLHRSHLLQAESEI